MKKIIERKPRLKGFHMEVGVRILILATAMVTLICGACLASDLDVQQLLAMAPNPADYPNDAKATVVDFAEYTLNEDGTMIERVHGVTMVLNERGRKGDESVMYTEGDEVITVIRARTILKTGDVVDVAPKDMQITSVFAGYDLYENIKQLRFTYPAIEDGALLEFEYERKTLRPLLPNYLNFGWVMQTFEPTMGSELIIHAPKDRKILLEGFNDAPKPTKTSPLYGGAVTYHWTSKAYPAIESEPYMPGHYDIAPWISIATQYTWRDIEGVLAQGVKGKTTPGDEIKSAVSEIIAGAADDEEKIRRIYYWIQDNMRDVGASAMLTRYDARSADEVYRKRYGNNQAITGLMIAMLDAAGIKARWAFTSGSARSGASQNDSVSFDDVGDCLCYVKLGDKEYWLEPMAECRALGNLSSGYKNTGALVLKDDGFDFMDTPKDEDEQLKTVVFTDVELSPNGDARVRVSQRSVDDAAVSNRVEYKYAKPDELEKTVRSWVQSNSASGTLVDYTYPDWRDFAASVARVSYTFDAKGWAQVVGNYLIVRPNAAQASREGADPFPNKERKYDLSFGGSSPTRSIFTVTIPEGYEIESLPENFVRSVEFGDIAMQYSVKGNRVVLSTETLWKGATLPKSRLPEVRQFFVDMGKRGRDAIVLKKK